MRKNRVLLFIAGIIIGSSLYPQGQNFAGEALSEMDKAFSEAETEFTSRDEYYLGRAVAAVILGRYKPYTANPDLTNYLNLICRTLVINSSQPEIFKGYYVVILDSPEYNAFATPGGHIFITRALVEAALSEDALASIIAHELAHILLKHGMGIVYDMKLNERMAGIAERAAEFNSKNADDARRAIELRNSVMVYIDAMLQNGYSQAQEYEADQAAAGILAASGYDPQALVDMLKVLQKVQGSRQGGFNTTHPSPEQRIASLEKAAESYRSPDTRPYRLPRFKKLLP